MKEFPRLEKLPNTEKKLEYNKYLEKSPSPIIMLLNIFVNIFLNISQKDKSNTLPRKEKLKNINTFQLKDKSSTIRNNLLKSVAHNTKLDCWEKESKSMFKEDKLNTSQEDNTWVVVGSLVTSMPLDWSTRQFSQFKENTEPLKTPTNTFQQDTNKLLTSQEDQESDNKLDTLNKDTPPNRPTCLEDLASEDLKLDNESLICISNISYLYLYFYF